MTSSLITHTMPYESQLLKRYRSPKAPVHATPFERYALESLQSQVLRLGQGIGLRLGRALYSYRHLPRAIVQPLAECGHTWLLPKGANQVTVVAKIRKIL